MDFSILGICWGNKSFKISSINAPIEIRKSFPRMETFVNGIDLNESAFFSDLGDIKPRDYKEMELMIKEKLNKRNFPVIIGGDHSISYASVKAVEPKVFVSFDAHPDCEDKELCYSSVTRKIIEGGYKTVLYGVRSFSKKESDFIDKNRIKIATIRDLKTINEPTYLSIDFDVLDPSIMPNVNCPEPNGLTFQQVLDAIRVLAKNLIAVDFVEFVPTKNITYTLIAAKLIYSTLAGIIRSR